MSSSLTCRKRHKKCDERRPVCGPCLAAQRSCLFPRIESDRGTEAHIPTAASARDITIDDHNAFDGSDAAGLLRDQIADSAADWSPDVASNRWWDLLANDAEQTDLSFFDYLAPTESLAGQPAFVNEEVQSLSRQDVIAYSSPALLNGQARFPENSDPRSERLKWQLTNDIILLDHETSLFRHFTDRCSSWLDLLDSQRLFSTYATRLALRNVGLMKAILALSANHRVNSVKNRSQEFRCQTVDMEVRYYYETLHYVREALKYPSYSHSEELLATALIISAYEMLGEADGSGNWQRHLKGIFWIQRSQDVDGECGGLRQSVWWAWLRQDIWAAFREQRTCHTIWRPSKEPKELDKHEVLNRAMYLLSQAVNHSANARECQSEDREASPGSLSMSQLNRAGESLLADLNRWKLSLGADFDIRLPVFRRTSDVFQPIWVHPPQISSALQAYHLALILLALHSPKHTGFGGYLKLQQTLSTAINTICGIAMELKDEGCQMFSAQCLYGAGLCLQDVKKRAKVLSMIEDCETRVGWAPMAIWRADLVREWAKADSGETTSPI